MNTQTARVFSPRVNSFQEAATALAGATGVVLETQAPYTWERSRVRHFWGGVDMFWSVDIFFETGALQLSICTISKPMQT